MEHIKSKLDGIRPTFLLSGETKDRDGLIQSLQDSQEYCLIAQAQCSEGWEMPNNPVTIFYSMSWRFVDKIQFEGRQRRINHPKKNLYITLVVENSADEAVYDAISNKQDFQVALYDARKGLPNKTHPLDQVQHRP